MTIYSITNQNATTLNAEQVFSASSGFTIYTYWLQVAPNSSETVHVSSIAQIPSPFNGTVQIYGDAPFTAQIVGYDYPTTTTTPSPSTPTPTATSSQVTPTLSPTPVAITGTVTLTTSPTVTAAVVTATATATATSGATPGDLAYGHPASASSTAPGSSPSLAVDGNAGTYWASAAGGSQWLYVDLGASTALQRVTIIWGPAYATYYYVEYSSDATNWTPVWTVSNGTGSESVTPSGTARYVRIRATTGVNTSLYQLASLEVFGTPSPTVTAPSTTTWTPTPTMTATPPPSTTPTPTATRRRRTRRTPTATAKAMLTLGVGSEAPSATAHVIGLAYPGSW